MFLYFLKSKIKVKIGLNKSNNGHTWEREEILIVIHRKYSRLGRKTSLSGLIQIHCLILSASSELTHI